MRVLGAERAQPLHWFWMGCAVLSYTYSPLYHSLYISLSISVLLFHSPSALSLFLSCSLFLLSISLILRLHLLNFNSISQRVTRCLTAIIPCRGSLTFSSIVQQYEKPGPSLLPPIYTPQNKDKRGGPSSCLLAPAQIESVGRELTRCAEYAYVSRECEIVIFNPHYHSTLGPGGLPFFLLPNMLVFVSMGTPLICAN